MSETRVIKSITGLTSTGGKIKITAEGGGGANNLSQSQFDAYKLAGLVINPLNGQDWQKARLILGEAGFDVYFE